MHAHTEEAQSRHSSLHRILSVSLALVLLVSLFAFPVSAATTSATAKQTYGDLYKVAVTGTADYKAAFKVLELVNAARKKAGKSALAADKAMMEAAMQRAAECSLYYAHVRPDGSDPSTLIDRVHSYGENIAAGFGSAAEVMDAWLNSPGHRANILDSNDCDFLSIGIGAFMVDGIYYWCQLFNGKAKQSSPTKKAAVTETRTVEIREKMMDPAINQSGLELEDGKTAQLTVANYNQTFVQMPTTLAASGLIFESKDTHVAKVSSKGTVTAVAGGSTQILVKSKNGLTLFKVPITVHSTTITAYITSTSAGKTKVVWSKVDGAAYYRVYKSVYSDGKWSKYTSVKTTKTLSYVDAAHKSGQKVKYYVAPYKNGKEMKSHATVVTMHLCYPNVAAASTAKGEKVTWSKVAGASYYKVSRSVYSDGKWSAYTTLKSTKTLSFTDTTVKAGQKVHYAVTAYNGSYHSIKSVCTVTYLKQPTLKLAKATKGVKLSWNTIKGAGTYRVYKSVYTNGKWSAYSYYKTTKSTTYTDTAVKKGQKVRYTVYAVCGSCKNGKSAFKSGVAITR